MIRKREPRWQSAADRARVAAELLEEAESLSENSTIATPAEVARASLPPPIRAQLPDAAPPTAPEGGAGGAPAGTDAPATAAPGLDELVAREPDNVGLLLQRAEVLCARRHLTAAQRDLERVLRQEPGNPKALYGCGIVLDRLNRPVEATQMYRRSREAAGR